MALVPSITEQKEIVEILDAAFAGIDKAIENTERNLVNAQELFDSYLNAIFTKQGEGWEKAKFGDCFRLRSGDGLTAKAMINGPYPVYGGNGIAGQHNKFNLSGSNIIIGRVGALCGNVRHIEEKIWLTDNAFKIVDFKFKFDESFLTYFLNYKDLRSLARQAAQPVISNSSLQNLTLSFPILMEEQIRISSKLKEIENETLKAQAIYKQKVMSFNDLKQAILQKAFSGELTKSSFDEFDHDKIIADVKAGKYHTSARKVMKRDEEDNKKINKSGAVA